jgi:mannosyltransferase OCH1-like enzyme
MAIPRQIFQTWKSREVTNPFMKRWQESWTNLNPSYKYTIWDDDDNRSFVKEHFPDFLETYDSYKQNICRADVIRYLYLYVHGGIYTDLDFMCLKPFESIINSIESQNVDITFGTLGPMDDETFNNHDIPNAIIISKPKADFWLFVIKALSKCTKVGLPPELQTGPVLIKFCINAYAKQPYDPAWYTELFGADIFKDISVEYSSAILLASKDIFYPINWGKRTESDMSIEVIKKTSDEITAIFPKSYAITFWMHSW